MFDPIGYMRGVHGKLKATKDKYRFVRVSNVNSLEEVLENAKKESFFFAVEDSQDGVTVRKGGGYFERRPYTVFVLGNAEYGNMDQRETILAEAKSIFRSIFSKLIKDKLNLPILDLEQIRFYEVPAGFAMGCAGLFFTFTIENPVSLVYNAEEWV